MNDELWDMVIVGGGPAGLTAGLYAARANLRVLLIEKLLPGGELLNTDLIEDYPGFVSVTGRELSEKMEEHARKFGLKIETNVVTKIEREDDREIIRVSRCATASSRLEIRSSNTDRRPSTDCRASRYSVLRLRASVSSFSKRASAWA